MNERETVTSFDFMAHLQRQREWSERTFGPGPRTQGVLDHIRKELSEIEDAPRDLGEWIDVVILALDGAWRCGASPDQIIAALAGKQARNEVRQWPDWRTADPNKAIEHVRTGDYYVLVEPWAVYVKEASYFEDQGGLTEEWGKKWRKVQADSIEHAREIGKSLGV